MFGNLFGKKDKPAAGPAFTYITYISTEAKFNALAGIAKADNNLHFITWFPDTTTQLKTLFSSHGLNTARIHEGRNFHSGMLSGEQAVIVEVYPLHDKEKTLVQNWPQQEVKVYCGLDEPFFKAFGGDKIISLMEKMGMKADEPVQHALISQSIINAQKKIATKVVMEQTAASQLEWMEKNVKI